MNNMFDDPEVLRRIRRERSQTTWLAVVISILIGVLLNTCMSLLR